MFVFNIEFNIKKILFLMLFGFSANIFNLVGMNSTMLQQRFWVEGVSEATKQNLRQLASDLKTPLFNKLSEFFHKDSNISELENSREAILQAFENIFKDSFLNGIELSGAINTYNEHLQNASNRVNDFEEKKLNITAMINTIVADLARKCFSVLVDSFHLNLGSQKNQDDLFKEFNNIILIQGLRPYVQVFHRYAGRIRGNLRYACDRIRKSRAGVPVENFLTETRDYCRKTYFKNGGRTRLRRFLTKTIEKLPTLAAISAAGRCVYLDDSFGTVATSALASFVGAKICNKILSKIIPPGQEDEEQIEVTKQNAIDEIIRVYL